MASIRESSRSARSISGHGWMNVASSRSVTSESGADLFHSALGGSQTTEEDAGRGATYCPPPAAPSRPATPAKFFLRCPALWDGGYVIGRERGSSYLSYSRE